MRIAHIIMAHKAPKQLARLIENLNHPQFDFYIHIDSKIPMDSFKYLSDIPNVYFIKNRKNCNWGGNSLLIGIISALDEVLSQNKHYDFLNLLSGQDYPIATPDQICNFFSLHPEKNFISYDPHTNTQWWNQAKMRYEKYHFTDLNFKWKYFAERIVNKLLPNRKFPIYSELYGSCKSTWWTISTDCAKLIARELTTNKKLINFIKYSWGTDEFVVATIIMNSDFKQDVINDNLRYIDWSEGNPNPKMLGINDFEQIKSSQNLFARKFDIEFDSDILDAIDKKYHS